MYLKAFIEGRLIEESESEDELTTLWKSESSSITIYQYDNSLGASVYHSNCTD